MQICQNPNCPNPFNPDGNKFCISCGSNNFGKLLRNRFQVEKVLGEGGFGRTYLAADIDRLDAACVIKQFLPQVQGTNPRTKATELFKEEAKRLFELGENHTQIPRLLAYFEQGSSLYLVQEFIEGETLLTQVLLQPFGEAQIRELLQDLLPVLQFVHERNIIHRDIKPENIIRRKDSKLVLIDFGGAKQVTQTSLARQGTQIHTIGYAPTEQMQGYACAASDLYALGVTCARLLTGCFPAQDVYGNLYDTLYDAVNAEWLWREHLPQGVTVSDDLGRILDKLLKHFVKERYQSATEVISDLQGNTFPVTPGVAKGGKGGLILQTFEFDVITVDAWGKETNRKRHQAEYFGEDLGNGVSLEMVQIPGGTFIMGSPINQRHFHEKPQHQVTVQPFFMGKFPITQKQYETVMGTNPSHFKGANLPVEQVSWDDAVEFCARLSKQTGRTYRLPSEAEWEYATRAGTTTPFYFGETITSDLANYDGKRTYAREAKSEYRQRTTRVGMFPPNAFGLYDMHGLVWEWCADPWHSNYYGAPNDGTVWQHRDQKWKIVRGGSWYEHPVCCRCAYRARIPAYDKNDNKGFRVVCEVFAKLLIL